MKIKWVKILGVGALCMVGQAYADGSALWRAVGVSSPTALPTYVGQPAPFVRPVEAPVVGAATAVSTTEEIERLQKGEEALHTAEILLNSPQGYRPNFGAIQIEGKTDGLMGPRVMISGDWVGANQTLFVKRQMSPAAEQALEDLSVFNKVTADNMRKEFAGKLAQTPYISVKLAKINKDSIEFQSIYGSQTFALTRLGTE